MPRRIPIAKAGKIYRRLALGINAAAIRELAPVMDETARDVIKKHFVFGGPEKKPLATKIVSRTGQLASTVAPLTTKLTQRGIEAGIKMSGIQARGLEEGATISHPGNVGKLQVFKPKGSRRTIFTRKTRAHIITIRKRAPLKKTMRRWRKRHLDALRRGAFQAANKVGLVAKVS